MKRLHWIVVGGMAAGLLLLLGLGWHFVLRPIGAEHAAKLVELADLQSQLETTKKRAAQFEKFKAEAENVRRDLDFYIRRLDPDLSSAELYTLVNGIGNSFNLKGWSFSSQPRAKTKTSGLNLDEVEVRAKFESDFERLGLLLNLMVSQVRPLVPETLLVNRVPDSAGLFLDTLNVDLVFKVFLSEAKP